MVQMAFMYDISVLLGSKKGDLPRRQLLHLPTSGIISYMVGDLQLWRNWTGR